MFDIGWSELLVIGIVALVVIGPKDLPQAFRIVGQWVARARTLAREFQSHVDEMMREADVQDMKREFRDMTRVPEFEEIEADLMRGDLAPEGKPTLKPVQGADGETKPATPANEAMSSEGEPKVTVPPAS
jgi:sec-independent protein translocase protein TatB